jgi:hypothetical protein
MRAQFQGLKLLSLLSVIGLALLSGQVSANSAAVGNPYSELVLTMLVLFVLNFPINLALYMAFSWVALKWDWDAFFQARTRLFVAMAVFVSAAVTFCGVFIDSVVLVSYWYSGSGGGFWMFILFGLAGVFFSVFALSHLLQGARIWAALLVATGMTVVNAVFWHEIFYGGGGMVFATLVIMAYPLMAFALLLFTGWYYFNAKYMTDELAPSREPMTRKQGVLAGALGGFMALTVVLLFVLSNTYPRTIHGGTPAGAWVEVRALDNRTGRLVFGSFTRPVEPMDIMIVVNINGGLKGTVSWSSSHNSTLVCKDLPEVSAVFHDLHGSVDGIKPGDYVIISGLEHDTEYWFEVFHFPTDSTISMVGYTPTFTTPP